MVDESAATNTMSSKGPNKRPRGGGGGRGKAAAAIARSAAAASTNAPPVPPSANKKKSAAAAAAGSTGPTPKAGGSNNNNDLPEASYLVTCDVPTKQYIHYLNEIKSLDKKFIIEDLDETHLLVKLTARDEIEQKIDAWMDENVFSAIEKVGEDLDIS
jgi:hypothetical protein